MTDLHVQPQVTTIEVRNPADGSVVGEVPEGDPESLANGNASSWSATLTAGWLGPNASSACGGLLKPSEVTPTTDFRRQCGPATTRGASG